MSLLAVNIYKKKLHEYFSQAKDGDFLLMLWAVDALQDKRADHMRNLLFFPKEAETDDLLSRYFFHKWKIETLANELLRVEKKNTDKPKILNCRNFNAAASIYNVMGKLENAESRVALDKMPILHEIFRIGQKQFEWQRGFVNLPLLYRSAYIHGGEKSRAYFEATHGVSLAVFMEVGFAIYAHFRMKPIMSKKISLNEIGVADPLRDASLKLLSITIEDARRRAKALHHPNLPTEYQPSLFRQFPCIVLDNVHVVAPLPSLIVNRINSGIFYDLVAGPQDVKTEIGLRFESYVLDLLQHLVPSFRSEKSFRYRYKKNEIDSADVLLSRSGLISVVIECKARRMPFEAKFAGGLLENAEILLAELAKGVYQIWRFFSHLRQGIVPGKTLDKDALGLLVTLDTWLSHSSELQKAVLEKARSLADAQDVSIIDVDRRPIVFCAAVELEETLLNAADDDFLRTLHNATRDDYAGWALPSVHAHTSDMESLDKDFPFREKVSELLPWFDIEAIRERRR